ncbi:hypothetical protein T484DRAFT_1777383, partial [Baffinella frigidus]
MVLLLALFTALFAVSISRLLPWYLARQALPRKRKVKRKKPSRSSCSTEPFEPAIHGTVAMSTPLDSSGETHPPANPPPRMSGAVSAREIAGGEQAPVQFLVVKVPECSGVNGGNLPLWRARDAAAEQLRALQTRALGGEFSGVLLMRVEAGVRGFGVEEAMLWLRVQPPFPKVFFMNPEGSHMCAGAGSAHLVTGDGELHAPLLPEGTPPSFRYYGGSRFDAGAQVGVEWEKFGGHFFVLPQ